MQAETTTTVHDAQNNLNSPNALHQNTSPTSLRKFREIVPQNQVSHTAPGHRGTGDEWRQSVMINQQRVTAGSLNRTKVRNQQNKTGVQH